uniref:Mediator of RNA polymerase II transcription subunit 10 n=1 Tax=Panagrolaimus sp. JU765 TaxID=591449 RepID=A0AC34Q758_9BILA
MAPEIQSPLNEEQKFNVLEQTLEQFQENARQMGVIASEFTARSQEPLNQKIHTMIHGLRQLDTMKDEFKDVRVPAELLDHVDQGKNPQFYTKELLERTLAKNKEVNGKIELYKKFRARLIQELANDLPYEVANYAVFRPMNNL